MKTARGIVGIFVLLAACGGQPEAGPVTPAPTATAPAPAAVTAAPAPTPAATQAAQAPKPPMIEMQKKHIAESDAAWAAHDVKKLMSLYADDAVIAKTGPSGLREQNKAEAEAEMTAYFSAFPDAKIATSRALADGNVAVAEWVVNGTNKGDLMGEKATNKPVGYRGVTAFWYNEDGKVKREQVYFDMGTAAGQMGKAPKGHPFRAIEPLPTTPTEWIVSTAPNTADEGTVKALYDLWAKHDEKGVLALLTDTAVMSNNYEPADVKKSELAKTFKEGAKTFPDSSWDVKKCWTAKDLVACDILWTATFKGPMKGVKPTNKKGTVHGLDIVHFKDGKIDQVRGYGSGIEFAAAFGLMPEVKPGDKSAKAAEKPAKAAEKPAKADTKPAKADAKKK